MANQLTVNPATITKLGYAVDSSFAMYAEMKPDTLGRLHTLMSYEPVKGGNNIEA